MAKIIGKIAVYRTSATLVYSNFPEVAREAPRLPVKERLHQPINFGLRRDYSLIVPNGERVLKSAKNELQEAGPLTPSKLQCSAALPSHELTSVMKLNYNLDSSASNLDKPANGTLYILNSHDSGKTTKSENVAQA